MAMIVQALGSGYTLVARPEGPAHQVSLRLADIANGDSPALGPSSGRISSTAFCWSSVTLWCAANFTIRPLHPCRTRVSDNDKMGRAYLHFMSLEVTRITALGLGVTAHDKALTASRVRAGRLFGNTIQRPELCDVDWLPDDVRQQASALRIMHGPLHTRLAGRKRTHFLSAALCVIFGNSQTCAVSARKSFKKGTNVKCATCSNLCDVPSSHMVPVCASCINAWGSDPACSLRVPMRGTRTVSKEALS